MDVDVRLLSFGAPHVEVLEPWFDDPETQARLGDRSWIRRAPSLLDLPVGEEFRGMITTGRHMWISIDELDTPIGYVDGETYDRYAAWDGSDPDAPAISDVVELPSMGLTVVIDPARRRSGYGAATLRAAIDHPDVAHIRLFFGGIEPDNVASIRCAERAGFRCLRPEPDFEGMLYYSLER